jgi:UDPglucose 6-dehydrogenase
MPVVPPDRAAGASPPTAAQPAELDSLPLTVVGAGYVGLVAAACFAELGHTVTCVDRDADRVADLRRGRIPIHEPGLEDLVVRTMHTGHLRFGTDVTASVPTSRVVFIAVGTPPGEDGSADLSHVLAVADAIAPVLAPDTVVVNKSTVPVGTADAVAARLALRTTVPFAMCSNPEFLKEGDAVLDFLHPDRVVVGTDDPDAAATMQRVYAPIVASGARYLAMDVRSAEMTKYAANGMLATRIAFMNEVAALCDASGADIEQVRRGIGSDRRIGEAFLKPGPGFGGSCFPKDLRALEATATRLAVPAGLITAVETANARHMHVPLDKAKALLGAHIDGARVAVWGVAFKAGTDDVRESPAIPLVRGLLDAGAQVVLHDPEALDNARRTFGDAVRYDRDPWAAARAADLLVVMTEWPSYRDVDPMRLLDVLAVPRVLDARNLFDPALLRALGFTYASIGRDAVGVNRSVHAVASH